jgi:hypothetical protein
MPRRSLLLLPAVLAALSLPVAPALAGGGDDDDGDDSASAILHATQCVSAKRAKVRVTGDQIDSVRFIVDGDRVKTDGSPNSGGRYTLSMRCSHLRVGVHRGRAVVSFEEGASRTLRFQITRSRQTSPRFTG